MRQEVEGGGYRQVNFCAVAQESAGGCRPDGGIQIGAMLLARIDHGAGLWRVGDAAGRYQHEGLVAGGLVRTGGEYDIRYLDDIRWKLAVADGVFGDEFEERGERK